MSTQPTPDTYSCDVIAIIESPFKEKFGIPRQPGLVGAEGMLVFRPPFDQPEMVEGLEGFSHLWLTFVFHACVEQGWQARVRPPRLGGNRKVGVYASRAPFRPNHLGLSVVELVGVERDEGLRLRLRGLDLMDGTPVLDVKPYVPYTDALPEARAGYAPEAPEARLAVRFSPEAEAMLAGDEALKSLIREVLALDPRPAYHAYDPARVYGMQLADRDVRWRVCGQVVEVVSLQPTR